MILAVVFGAAACVAGWALHHAAVEWSRPLAPEFDDITRHHQARQALARATRTEQP